MGEFSRLVITSKGQALIAKIMTGKGNIAFTKVSASNAEYVLEQLESLTELSDIRQTVPVSKISRTNEVAITIEAVFHNLELTEGYHMRALGLYATDPDEGEILYAVTMEISGSCYMPAYNGIAVSEAYIKLVTTVGNSESVFLEVNLAAVVTVGDMNSLRDEITKTYLPKTGDSAENTVEFESNDSENATSWTDVPVMESKEKHKSLFEKVSTMFKNVRFLYKILGSEDISQVGDGTVTGILQELKQVALTGSYNDLDDTPRKLPASDVYTWAKQPTKPSYNKTDVGLGNVDNTADINKPVSTAQQTELDKKVNIASILTSIEQVDANTTAKNIVDALVIKALKSNLMNSINQVNTALDKRVTKVEQKSFYEDQIEVYVSLTETGGSVSQLFNDEVDFIVIKNGDCIHCHTCNAIYIEIPSEKAANYIDVSINISTDYLIDGIIKFTLFTLDISKVDFCGLDAPQPVSNTIASVINNRVGLRFKYPRDTILNELMGLELSLEVIGKIKE